MTGFDGTMSEISRLLTIWYSANFRPLPWRYTDDPFKIWLSEIILQQTRVDQGMPYYYRFVELFPSIADLANAQEHEVLRAWQGLGYYSRARNMHHCAKIIVNQYNGIFPDTCEELEKLPGIGPYTSAAIASIAFKRKVAVIDGNVIRVVSRLFGIQSETGTAHNKAQIGYIANQLISEADPAVHNQAMMEFGALQCVPKNPDCENCIFNSLCQAYALGIQNKLPIKPAKRSPRNRFFHYLVIERNRLFMMSKREGRDIWNGLYEFYLIEAEELLEFDQLALPDFLKTNNSFWLLADQSYVYKHVLSHQVIHCKFFRIKLNSEVDSMAIDHPGISFYSLLEIEALPKSVLITSYLDKNKLIGHKNISNFVT